MNAYDYIKDNLAGYPFNAKYPPNYEKIRAVAGLPIVAHQLALESGYRSYSTFSTAFKQRMHKSVIAWIHEEEAVGTRKPWGQVPES